MTTPISNDTVIADYDVNLWCHEAKFMDEIHLSLLPLAKTQAQEELIDDGVLTVGDVRQLADATPKTPLTTQDAHAFEACKSNPCEEGALAGTDSAVFRSLEDLLSRHGYSIYDLVEK